MPPRSTVLSPYDLFLWGYVKGLVYVAPLPARIDELNQRNISALDIARSAGAVEYTDCFSAEGLEQSNECPVMTLSNLMVSFL